MTPELTPQEIEQITKEAANYAFDWMLTYWSEDLKIKDIKMAYVEGVTAERLKHKAEIQAYREFLEYIIDFRKDESVSKEMLAVFAENVIVKYQNHQP